MTEEIGYFIKIGDRYFSTFGKNNRVLTCDKFGDNVRIYRNVPGVDECIEQDCKILREKNKPFQLWTFTRFLKDSMTKSEQEKVIDFIEGCNVNEPGNIEF